MESRRGIFIFALIIFASGCTTTSREASQIDNARLIDADSDTENWLTYGRTYSEQRFSPLDQIREDNIDELGLLWSRELGSSRGLEATPLVVDGVLYTTGTWSKVYAFDARTGDQLWMFDPAVDRTRARIICCDVVNRGLAMYGQNVYVGALDGRLIAVDRATGDPVWETQTFDRDKPYSVTGAPRIANGMVVIGNGGAEVGVRGYVSAYDAVSGDLIWRTYTVPGDPALGFESEALEMAAETWSGEWWVAGGGGTAWDSIVYDPELNTVYIGVGNGSPWYRDLRGGAGDHLFLASILAVDADTGEYKWHFQTTPGDNWDYTATAQIMMATLSIDGEERKVVMQAPKNGFFYVIDRETGEFISGENYIPLNWAEGLDPDTGRPIEAAEAYTGLEAFIIIPGPDGGHNWHPMAFNPSTGLVYIPTTENLSILHHPDKDWEHNPTRFNAGIVPGYEGPLEEVMENMPSSSGHLLAWDPVAQEARWKVNHPTTMSGGVLATGGNLVFQGRADGMLLAYRATDGEILWEFDAGTGIIAPPVSYTVDGTQYLTVMVGWGGAAGMANTSKYGPTKPGFGRILTFVVGGEAALDPPDFGRSEPPTPAITMETTPEEIKKGELRYNRNCLGCHGIDVVAGGVPDLRYSSAAIHAQFEDIVLNGSREFLGMPRFDDVLTSEDVRAIQAFVLHRAAESASGG